MKKIVPIIKLILAAIFLYNIGVFSLIGFIGKIDQGKQPPLKADHGQRDIQYLNEKIRQAKVLGKDYGPELYFADLAEINLKQKKNDFDRNAVIFTSSTINNLLGIFNENVINFRRHGSDAEYSNYLQRLSVAQKKCENILDPGSQKRSAEFKIKTQDSTYWLKLLLSLLSLLGNLYWRNLPLALILLWLWWYRDKETLKVNNPLSFLICLVLYPIVIIRIWSRSMRFGARMFAMGIDFKRRQTDIFSMISNDELADIKRFAKSELKISDYRKYLENRSFIYRHTLLPVIIVSFVFLIIPQAYSAPKGCDHASLTQYHLALKIPPGFNQGVHKQHDKTITVAIITLSQKIVLYLSFVSQIILPPTPKPNVGFLNNPDPVPLAC